MRFFDGRLRLALTALLILSPNLLSASASAQGLFDFLGGGGAPRHAEPPSPPPAAPPPPVKKKPTPAKTDKPAAAAEAQQKTSAPVVSDAPPPYEAQLLRLTEMIGALAYLRDLCGAGDGDEWRVKMTALLNAEAPSGSRRDKLSSSFNRGFRGYELTYRACTPNAQAVIVRYMDETGRISQDIAYRYGNP
jgi:uncharacterized protein (TIGR02301 family)